MFTLGVLIAGPWRGPLTYLWDEPLEEGVPVKVPLGRGGRDAFGVVTVSSLETSIGVLGELKSISKVLGSPLPQDLWYLVGWSSKWLGIPMGKVLELVAPRWVYQDKPSAPILLPRVDIREDRKPLMEHVLLPSDHDRVLEAARMYGPRLVALFPQRQLAAVQGELLRREGFKVLEWPSSPSSQRKAYLRMLSGDVEVVVGSHGAAFLPFPPGWRVFMDDESSDAWIPISYPTFSIRAMVVERCRVSGVQLLLGSRLPSSKVFLRCARRPEGDLTAAKRVMLVKPNGSSGVGGLLSYSLINNTRRALRAGNVALWILDRKGYAGYLVCLDCGEDIKCVSCEAAMRLDAESGVIRCPSCGDSRESPERCPICGGPFFEMGRVGLQAVVEEARQRFRDHRVLYFDGDMLESQVKDLIKGAKPPFLAVGTRSVLSLCDLWDVSLAAWLEADTEGFSKAGYDRDFRALSLMWESLWRGKSPEGRTLLVQTLRPARGWRRFLRSGWRRFWELEIKERLALGMPPFTKVLKIRVEPSSLEAFRVALAGLESSGGIMGFAEDAEGFTVKLSRDADVGAVMSCLPPPLRLTSKLPVVWVFSD
ncbi:hypothetical protein TheveDRAFT_1003 [Thermanaerovibrio velox DSM 12556]|uniref:Primosomal protein N' 3' DNA-binding domain-containing protein n=1 Tax=Thermanaerovibrio velox DSM 12556 TaxID=926567 RepID=H0US43_9BACT|nr:hypothetical protein [Thermanaerovibrio velox]EHM10132.1 hypothetical protein TheveDRAFT_1003 [Thermanaerovibrio velox DSM 12556]